ncbi:MAG: peptidoglycan-binding protein [Cyanobacteriota bacterium]|nr:peptidoglycan-binding protein [Cyanobacteriota bacterium]
MKGSCVFSNHPREFNDPMPLTHATITDVSHPNRQPVPVLFNPSELAVDAGSHYASMPVPGLSMPILQYIRGEAEVLNLELFLDRTDQGRDVQTDIDELLRLVTIDSELHAPPVVDFAWSRFRFTGVVTSLRRRMTLFAEDGRPLRARLNLSLRSYKSAEVQLRELKLSSPDRSHARVLREGETLAHVAYDVYGDPRLWRPIAEANGIRRPRFIPPGTPLWIPAL